MRRLHVCGDVHDIVARAFVEDETERERETETETDEANLLSALFAVVYRHPLTNEPV